MAGGKFYQVSYVFLLVVVSASGSDLHTCLRDPEGIFDLLKTRPRDGGEKELQGKQMNFVEQQGPQPVSNSEVADREPGLQTRSAAHLCHRTKLPKPYVMIVDSCCNRHSCWTSGLIASPWRNEAATIETSDTRGLMASQTYKDSADEAAPEESYVAQFNGALDEPEGAKERNAGKAGCSEDGELAEGTSESHDAVVLMQRKRGRATSPRRRRRDRAHREETRRGKRDVTLGL